MLAIRRASAPGKLVLFGEYAVLFGAPAIAMAVDRRAVVTLEPAADDRWTVTSSTFSEGEARFTVDPAGVAAWDDPEDGDRLVLVTRVFESMAAKGLFDPAGARPWRMHLDTTAFFADRAGGRRKLGLGSSAALTVALASALVGSASAGPSVDLEWLRSLVALHRAVQGGLGSGIDVAASLYGGVVRYRLDTDGSVGEAERMSWPDEVLKVFVWTGRSASTGSFLERLGAARAAGSRGVDDALDRLGQLSEVGVRALAQREPDPFLDAVDGYSDALEALGAATNVPILSDDHLRLLRAAVECGVHYKPSGAGGGDFGVCFGTDAGRLQEFTRRAMADGFATLKVDLDLSGARTGGM